MTHICVSKLGHHWFRYRLVAWRAPIHYMSHGLNIHSWTLGNKFQWHLNEKYHFKEYTFGTAVWMMSAILPRPQWNLKCFLDKEILRGHYCYFRYTLSLMRELEWSITLHGVRFCSYFYGNIVYFDIAWYVNFPIVMSYWLFVRGSSCGR